MNQKLDLLANLHQAYSSLINLGLYIVDDNGELLTGTATIDPVTEFIIAYQHLRNQFKDKIKKIDKPFFIELSELDPKLVGLRIMAVPVQIENQVRCYIFTEIYMEEKRVINELQHFSSSPQWSEALETCKVIPVNEVYEKFSTIVKMSSICKAILQNEYNQQRNLLVKELMNQDITQNFNPEFLLESFLNLHSELELISFVQKKRKGHWEVSFAKGIKSSNINGLKIESLQPLFDKVIETQSTQYIKSRYNPEFLDFSKKGIHPSFLLCTPVKKGQEVSGFILIITEVELDITDTFMNTIETLAGLTGLYQLTLYNKRLRNQNLMKVSRILELSKLKYKVTNVDELLFLMNEIIVKITKSSFVLISLKDGLVESTNTNMFIHDSDIEVYKNMLRCEMQQEPAEFERSKVTTRKIGKMLECPIFVNSKVDGVISVRIEKEELMNETEVYTELISTLAGEDFKRFKCAVDFNDLQLEIEDSLFVPSSIEDLLSRRENEILLCILKGHKNQEIADDLLISTHTVKNHISNIYQKLKVTNRRQIFTIIYQHQFFVRKDTSM